LTASIASIAIATIVAACMHQDTFGTQLITNVPKGWSLLRRSIPHILHHSKQWFWERTRTRTTDTASTGPLLFHYNLFKMFVKGVLWKGNLSRKDFPKDNAVGIDVGRQAIVFATDNFRGHVATGPRQPSGIETVRCRHQIFGFEFLSQAKIKKTHVSANIKTDILWFEISKQDSVKRREKNREMI
jgi:hypothetical protein